jgi:hypothetical protein
MARGIVSWAAVVALTASVAACGSSNEARSPVVNDGAGDAGHDGAGATGGQPCGSSGAADGPTRLATAKRPTAIAIGGGNVYWIDSDLGTVNEVSACGGAPTTLVTTSTLGSSTLIPAGIAVQGSDVYFTTQDPWNPDENDGAVWKVPSAGGAPTMLLQGLDHPGPVAVTGGSMYWIDSWQTHADDGDVRQAPIDGSSMTILASAQNGPWSLALGGGYVVWTTAGFVDSVLGSTWVTPLGGGGIVDGIAAAQNMPVSVAVEGADAFWANQGDPNVNNSGSIVKQHLDPKAAADPVTLASGGVPQGIAVDGAYVYWTDSQSQTVNEVPLAGGAPTTLAARQVAPVAIAVDDTSVYWTTLAEGIGQGAVMRIAK